MTNEETLKAVSEWASNIRQGKFSARLELNDQKYSDTQKDINRLAQWLQDLALQSQAELDLRKRKIKAQEKDSALLVRMSERTAFAHELHDSMAQTLASLRFQVRILDDVLQDVTHPRVWSQMETVEELVDLAHKELRSLIGQFRAPIESGNTSTSLEKILARFRTESGIPVFFQNQCEDQAFSEPLQIAIVRIAQEALKNVCKHSQAETVRLLLRPLNAGTGLMVIEDDGIGFDEVPQTEQAGMHIGLSVMKERAAQIGGTLQIDSEKGEGTQIKLTFALT